MVEGAYIGGTMPYWDIKESIRQQLREGQSWKVCAAELQKAIPGMTSARVTEIVYEVVEETNKKSPKTWKHS